MMIFNVQVQRRHDSFERKEFKRTEELEKFYVVCVHPSTQRQLEFKQLKNGKIPTPIAYNVVLKHITNSKTKELENSYVDCVQNPAAQL